MTAGPAHKPGRGGSGGPPPMMWSSMCRCFPLRACTELLSHPFQTGRVFFPLVPSDIVQEANYMSDRAKIIGPRTVSHFYRPSKMCVYFCRAKKGVHIFLLRYSLLPASPLFSEGQLNLFDRRTAEHLLKHSLFFPSFQTSTAAACRP